MSWNPPSCLLTLSVAAGFAVASCSLYIGDDDDDAVAADGGAAASDAGGPGPVIDGGGAVVDTGACTTTAQFLTDLAACMSFSDWQGTGMCDVPLQQTSAGVCADCHTDGTGGVLLSRSCRDTFDATRRQPYILGLVTPAADSRGCFRAFSAGSWLGDPGVDHPSYAFSVARDKSINDFLGFAFSRYSDPDFACTP